MFEGGCLRAVEQVKGYLALDHGPCPVKGDTKPLLHETKYMTSKVYVPTKCATCRYLGFSSSYGFVCEFEAERWGQSRRTLDWGTWSPEHPNLGLSTGRPVPPEMLQAVQANKEADGIKAFRDAFPDSTIREARDAFAELRSQWPKYGS